MTKVLEGIRVLDFGRFIAAPYCGMILADMGAEVIRIDRPGGEEDRTVGLKAPNGENLAYPSYARNKKCISLNVLLKDAPRDVLEDLVRISDVFLHNFSPGAIKAFALTYDDIKAIKPDIIYTGISCYGATGPYADRVGFDQIAQVFSGAAALIKELHPTWAPERIRSRLRATATDLGVPGNDPEYGSGLLDCYRAVFG